jgi:hypothetical protein
LTNIDKKFGKEDVQLISHVLNKLPNELYAIFKTTYAVQGFDKVTFHDFSSSQRDFWVNNVEQRSNHMAMTVDHEKKEKEKEKSLPPEEASIEERFKAWRH